MHLVAYTPDARHVAFFSADLALNFRRVDDTQPELARGEVKVPTTTTRDRARSTATR